LALAALALAHLLTQTAMVFVMSAAVPILKMDLECDMAEEPVNHSPLLLKAAMIVNDHCGFFIYITLLQDDF
jgi:hypothetical protein